MTFDFNVVGFIATLLAIPLVAISLAIAINMFYLVVIVFTALEDKMERYIKRKLNEEANHENH